MAETVRDEITQLAGSIRALERQLEVALAKRRVELNYVVHDGIVRFEHVMITKHRLLKARLLSYILGARPAMILTAPVICALIIPVLLPDLFVAVYPAAGSPPYRTPPVPRGHHPAIDRRLLASLPATDTLNCASCTCTT